MSNFPHSLVVICPDALRDDLLAMGAALGVDGGMSVPLSSDGGEPVTHYGAHSWAGPEFVAIMTGQVTPEIAGVASEDIEAMLSLITVSVDPVVDEQTLTKRAHFEHVIDGLGLQRVEAQL